MKKSKTIPSALIALVSVFASQAGGADLPEKLSLESANTKIVFCGGKIESITDIKSGETFACPDDRNFLYALNSPDLANSTITSGEAENLQTEKIGNSQIVFRAAKHRNLDIAVECRFFLDESDNSIRAKISLDNKTPRRISAVHFPVVRQNLSIAKKAENDVCVVPVCDGAIIRDPSNASLPYLEYPGSASMQFLARYNEKAGLYIAALDAEGFSKNIAFNKSEKSVGSIFINKLEFTAPHKWQSRDFTIKTFNGDWRDAAELYRGWAVKQKWCSRTLKQRVRSGDVPQWLAEPSFFFTFAVNRMPKKKPHEERIGQIETFADGWRELLKCPTTMMIMGWEKNGMWIAPDYFPPLGGSEKFKAAIDSLRKKSNRALVFLSGLNWTITNRATPNFGDYDRNELFFKDAINGAVCGIDGKYSRMTGHPHIGEFAVICPTTKQADCAFFNPLKECVAYGIDCVQADQIVGGKIPPCYSTKHGHPPFGGNWAANSMLGFFKKCRDFGKSKNRDFAFSVEEPNEFFIQQLDTYHARDYMQKRWPRDGIGWEGVPLFTYVYHDYINGYGGDSCMAVKSGKAKASDYYKLAMNLVNGKMPAMSVWNSQIQIGEIDKTQIAILQKHVALMRSHPQYLIFGRQIKGGTPNAAAIKKAIYDKSGKDPLDIPSVVHARWLDDKGNFADVYVCIAENAEFMRGGEKISMNRGDVKLLENAK